MRPMSTTRRRLWILTAFAMVWSLVAQPGLSGTFNQESLAGRTYWLYVPTGYQPGTAMPLLMMLHGCTQSGDGFATSTGMNTLADSEGFLVAYPQQPSSANATQCWNWFETANQSRGLGEPAHLAAVVADIEGGYTVASDQVFVAGFSAGAAMAVILGATYPDVFTALGVHSGLEYKGSDQRQHGLHRHVQRWPARRSPGAAGRRRHGKPGSGGPGDGHPRHVGLYGGDGQW